MPNLAEIGRESAKFGRSWPDFSQRLPMLAEIGGIFGPALANINKTMAHIGENLRIWANSPLPTQLLDNFGAAAEFAGVRCGYLSGCVASNCSVVGNPRPSPSTQNLQTSSEIVVVRLCPRGTRRHQAGIQSTIVVALGTFAEISPTMVVVSTPLVLPKGGWVVDISSTSVPGFFFFNPETTADP